MQSRHAVTAYSPSVKASQVQEAVPQLVNTSDLPAQYMHAAFAEASHTQEAHSGLKLPAQLKHVQKRQEPAF